MITQPHTQATPAKKTWTKPQLSQVGGDVDDIQAFSGMDGDGVYGASTS